MTLTTLCQSAPFGFSNFFFFFPWKCLNLIINSCPGFGQYRVNFHRNPGRESRKRHSRGGLTQPGQTEPGIPYHVPSRWVPVGGAARRELSLVAQERAAPVQSERAGLFLLCFLLICIVVVPVSLCLLFC